MKKINKILWFVYDFTSPGGGERWILEAKKIFSKNIIKTQIVCKNFDQAVFFNGKYNVPVTVISDRKINLNNRLSKLMGFTTLIFKLRKEIVKSKPQMVICQGFREYVIVYLISLITSLKYAIIDFGQIYQIEDIKIKYSFFYKKELLKINSIIETLGEKPDSNSPPNSMLKKIENEIKGLLIHLSYKRANHIFTLSEKVKNEDKLLYKRSAVVIKCAFHEAIFKESKTKTIQHLETKPIILTVGRLVSHKRIDLCLKAINILRKVNQNFIFYIGGSGPELKNLKRIVNELNIEEYVKFIGFINETKLIDYYMACEVFTTMDPADFDITTYVALALGKKVVWPKIMEIDSNLKSNKHIFPTEPNPVLIAETYLQALNSKVGPNSFEEELALKKYTYESCFLKMLKQFEEE